MARRLIAAVVTLMLTAPVIAETETRQDAWWTSSFQSATDGAKTCEVGTRLALREPGAPLRAAVLSVSYSSIPGKPPQLILVFVGDRPVSNTIRVQFDDEGSFTPPAVNDEAIIIFARGSPVLQYIRNATTMQVSLNLMHQGHTALTFSLRGSAKAMNSAQAACSQGAALELGLLSLSGFLLLDKIDSLGQQKRGPEVRVRTPFSGVKGCSSAAENTGQDNCGRPPLVRRQGRFAACSYHLADRRSRIPHPKQET